ncbi:ubiquinone biosynthesis protein COQ9, mitochondrial-like isoform X2 [Periplaneta americana]|uniref:ubiquinone biosynthesis protein COQ9, mitochondrial-like isoform X2 n=1 Tax=Periplaneta americana TaxID=6978 RepID=UPI0037E79FB5
MAVSVLHRLTRVHKQFVFKGCCSLWFNRCQSSDTTIGNVSSSSEEEENSSDQEENIKNRILKASLPFVHKYGWTKNAISEGAVTVGYPGTAHGLFPRGGAELVQYFYVTCNQELAGTLKKETEATAADPSKCKQPKEFIQDAVEQRLRMIIPYIDKWPQALGIMSLPPNVPPALANLLTLVDDICYYAGDRSVDFSWYSRRVTLAGIYKMTELYMIQDKSADFQETWSFLSRRIEDVSQLHGYLHQSEEASQIAKEAVTAAFITARNILGLNLGNR